MADNTLPSVLLLREAANVSRDNLISVLQFKEGTTERNAQLEQKIAAGTAREGGARLVSRHKANAPSATAISTIVIKPAMILREMVQLFMAMLPGLG